jgi:hypothetical protein
MFGRLEAAVQSYSLLMWRLSSQKSLSQQKEESQRHSVLPGVSSESELSIDCASYSPDIEAKSGYGIEGRAGSVPGYLHGEEIKVTVLIM